MRIRITSVCLLLAALCLPSGHAAILRVQHDAPGPTHDGSTWATAYTAVQPAIDGASPGDEVWVARGTYTGAITMKSAVALYGGFAGTETQRSQRDLRNTNTVLDGTTYLSPGYQVDASAVTIPADATSATVLDGFTVMNGTGTPVTITIKDNYTETRLFGGGIYVLGGSPVVRNNNIRNCTADKGGGIYVAGGNPRFEVNAISDNEAQHGGGIYVAAGDATILRNRIEANYATAYVYHIEPYGHGGGIYSESAVSVIGNVLARNDANDFGSAVSLRAGGTFLNNTVVRNGFRELSYDNEYAATLSFCASAGQTPPLTYANNIVAYNKVSDSEDGGPFPPRFVDLENGDYHLMADSPCVDAGNDAYLSTVGPHDIDGEIRKSGTRIDYGADEVVPVSARIVWTVPPSTAPANTFIQPTPSLKVVNSTGQTMTSYNGLVTLSIQPGTGTEGAAVAGNTVTAVDGVATFPSLAVTTPGAGYVLVPSGKTLYGGWIPGDASAPFDVLTAATRLEFRTQPAASSSRVPFNPAPVVAAVDDSGAVVPEFSGPVTLSIKEGTGTDGARMTGTATVNAVGGLATFDAASINKPGAGYVLVASNPLLASAESEPVSLVAVPVIRVRPDGNDMSSGATWDSAMKTVQAALDAAAEQGGGEVWVAEGTYLERLTVKAPTELYGGFAGTETEREERDVAAHPTVLDAEGKGRVLLIPDSTGAVTVDGFTIRNGAVYKSSWTTQDSEYGFVGGGIASYRNEVTLAHNTFTHNIADGDPDPYIPGAGDAVWLLGGTATVRDNLFTKNLGGDPTVSGGTLFSQEAEIVVERNRFIENRYRALICSGGSADVRNNLFLRNQGYSTIWVGSGRAENNTIVGNTEPMYPQATAVHAPLLANNIIAFNQTDGARATSAARNNCVFGNAGSDWVGMDDPTGTNGNIKADPLFVDRTADDYHLMAGSPCIDAGDDSAVPAGAVDLDGRPRIQGVHVEMGAYEFLAGVPVTWADCIQALKAAGGLIDAATLDIGRLDVAAGPSAEPAAVDLDDAVALARKAAGLDVNP